MPKSRSNVAIDDLIDDLDTLFDDVNDAIQTLGDDWTERLKRTHQQAEDPYGQRWKPRKNQHPHPPLIKSGRMLGSYSSKANKKSITISNNASYSSYHDQGTKTIDKRPLLPDDRGVPEEWIDDAEKAIDDMLRKKKLI